MPCNLIDDVDASWLQQKFVMTGGESVGHVSRMLAFVVARLAKSDGKCFEPLTAHLARQRHHGGRIDSARQKESDRNVGHKTEAYGIFQNGKRLFNNLI